MNWRVKLADWISGGALTASQEGYCEEQYLRHKYQEALRDVAAQEKPTSNATVRRMARMARGALAEIERV
jgi:hypothetical protein